MPGFLYFAHTTLSVATPQFRDGLGLSHLAGEDDRVESRQCNGPEGRGLIFQRRTGGEAALRYDKEAQTWAKCDGGKWWLGVTDGETPTPEILHRADGIGGLPVKLGDGQAWTVPVVTALPTAFGLTDGQIVPTHIDRFEPLRDDADRIYRRSWADAATLNGVAPDPGIEIITREECFDIACRVLSHNYRVSRWELAFLKAITTDNMAVVLEAMIDLPTILAVAAELKKNAEPTPTPDGSDTNSGSEDSHPDTAPLMQTSSG